jgi:hypothetical protein
LTGVDLVIRIGLVNIDTSHPKAFAEYLLKGDRARYTAIYNDGFRKDDEVKAYIGKYGLEKRCDSIEDLAQITDIGFIQSCNWDKHIDQALPFIKRGKPVFIDKPIAGNISDCGILENLVKDGAVIMGSSSVRYCGEIRDFMNTKESSRGRIMNIYGTAGVDEFNYGIHVVEGIGQLSGNGAVSNRFIGFSSFLNKICETYFIKFDSGITSTYNIFLRLWQPFDYIIMTTLSTYHFRIDTNRLYANLLDKICDFMETGHSDIAPVSEIIESVKIMLAGKISRTSGGKECLLDEISDDDPGYDGALFESEYAASAAKIYLD